MFLKPRWHVPDQNLVKCTPPPPGTSTSRRPYDLDGFSLLLYWIVFSALQFNLFWYGGSVTPILLAGLFGRKLRSFVYLEIADAAVLATPPGGVLDQILDGDVPSRF